jgi:hypothetical protein
MEIKANFPLGIDIVPTDYKYGLESEVTRKDRKGETLAIISKPAEYDGFVKVSCLDAFRIIQKTGSLEGSYFDAEFSYIDSDFNYNDRLSGCKITGIELEKPEGEDPFYTITFTMKKIRWMET